jgi:photosystem II stability/assembly factor-like uncharacterized protein
MKRTFISLLAILAFSFATTAQTWSPVNSNLTVGHGVGQISVGMNDHTALWAFATDATGLIVDEFTKSTDGGLTWTRGTFNAGVGLSQLFAIDATTCWAVFNTGATQGLYKTTDGGTTWAKKGTAFGSSSFADAMCFFNATEGFAIGDPAGGYFEIYTTTDGGENWTRVPTGNIPTPISGEYGITADYSSYGHFVWFGTNKGRIFRSANKGLNWTAVLTPFGTSQVIAPEFADSLNGIAYRSYLDVGIGDSVNVTTDGGLTWQGAAANGVMYGRYITHIPGTANTYVGSSGAAGSAQGVSYTTDGGHNWTELTSGGDYQATAWLDPAKGWAGSTAAAKKSTQGMFIYTGDSLLPLTARFTANGTSVALGSTVTFTNLSVGFPVSALWTFEGGTPPSSTALNPPAITYNTPGDFDVQLVVTNAGGSNTLLKAGYIHVGGVGINEQNLNTISVLPNPVKEKMTLQANSNISLVQIYAITGQLVLTQTVNSKSVTVNTSGLTAGVYNLKATTVNGTINKKIVIE